MPDDPAANFTSSAEDDIFPPETFASIAPDMSAKLGQVISDVAAAIEQEIGLVESVAPKDSPYAESLKLAYKRRLTQAAVAAISVVVSHPLLVPASETET